MGLRKEAIYLLMQEGLKRPFNGRIITLGKQDIWITYKELKEIAAKANFSLRPLKKIELNEKEQMQSLGYISDRTLFTSLGFEEIKSLDASSYENADLIYDLNLSSLPRELQGGFDLVLDPGTIEHVFHVPNSLKNIYDLLRVGGRVIHISPSSNHLDHGFYMFSPTLFWDYYTANQFDISGLRIIQYQPQPVFDWKIAEYVPGAFNAFSFGGLDQSMYAIYLIGTKTPHSTHDKIPQQYNFSKNLWNQKGPTYRTSKLKERIKKIRFLYKISLFIYGAYKGRKLQRKFKNLVR